MFAEPVTARRLGIGLALAVALLTSACAAGQHASTAEEVNTINGANADLNTIHLRALVIDPPGGNKPYYPAGSDLLVKLVIVNSGNKEDRLTSITSPAFGSWGSFGTTADAAAVLDAHSSSSAPTPKRAPSASGSPTDSGVPTDSAAPSDSVSTSLPTPSTSVVILPGGRAYWGTPESKGALLLMSTKTALYPGTTIPVTFGFENAGNLTVAVPISLSIAPHSSVVPEPSTSSIEG